MEVDRDLIDYDYIDYIKKQWSDNNLTYIVMGSCISFYNFRVDYASKKQHYDGELFLEENNQGGMPVTFMNMDAVRTKLSVGEIFRLNVKVSNERILRPWMYTFCKQKKSLGDVCSASEAEKNMAKGWWGLCSDKFDNTLNEWLVKLQGNVDISDCEKLNSKVRNNCLSDFWRHTIRELIEAIAHIHDCGLFHGSLNEYDNYVVVGDQLKLFNINGCLEGLKVQDQYSRKIQDFQEFRDTLKKLLEPSTKWLERDGFLNCFDAATVFSYKKYVEKLKNHPFLLTPHERHEQTRHERVGWVVRTDVGLLLQAGGKGGLWGGTATAMESEAIRKATVACISSGVNKVEVESDAMAIIQMIRGERRADMEEVAIVFYMQVLATEFQQVAFLHTSRRCNKVAHEVAAFVTRYGGNNACFIG
ncbi:unnamed protein product [Prunus armeniaca]